MKSTVKFRNLPSFPASDAVSIVIVDGDEIGDLSQAPDGTYWFSDYSEGEDFYLSPELNTLSEVQDAVIRLLRRIGYVEED
jgi:hypothetical protein